MRNVRNRMKANTLLVVLLCAIGGPSGVLGQTSKSSKPMYSDISYVVLKDEPYESSTKAQDEISILVSTPLSREQLTRLLTGFYAYLMASSLTLR